MGLLSYVMPWRIVEKFTFYKGGGGGGSSTQTVQNYSPEEVARRTAVMDRAQQIYDSTSANISNSPYPGSAPVGFSPESVSAQRYSADLARVLPGMNDNLWSATMFGLNDVMSPETNPYLTQTIDAAVRPITQSYTDPNGVMSQIRTDAVNNGGYGTSSRQAIAEGLAAGRYANAVGDTAATLANEGYKSGLDTFGRTLALAPQTMQQFQQPINLLSATGAQKENLAQQNEDYMSQSRLWDLNADWTPLQNWANIVFGAGSNGSTSVSSGGGYQRSALGGALGGAMTGASLGSMLGYGATNPYFAVGGALLGGLGLF